MFKFLIFFNFLLLSNALPNKDKCCIDNSKRKKNSLQIANYDCSQLTTFGENRCKGVLGDDVCKWGICPQIGKCSRISKYELHYNKYVDVGSCVGMCQKKEYIPNNIDSLEMNSVELTKPSLTCSPSVHNYIELKKGNVKVIKECECQNCGVKPKYDVIKVPVGSCSGKCREKNNICLGGVKDNYSQSNGLEVTNPSIALLGSAAGICSLGVQNGFDMFIDNRCFVHTFEDCIREGECPIRTLLLDLCIQAAQVSLTNTDSLRLGTNGLGLWGIGLPTLNGGSWNPGDNLCLTLDLDNLGGNSIINNVINDGNLDVLVQDDTAVDFLRLTIQYENCEECLPIQNTVHSFYTSLGLQEFRHIRDCDCLDVRKCHREILEETYYPGTGFEITLDIGQCLGKCETGSICNKKMEYKQIKTPYGGENIGLITDCHC